MFVAALRCFSVLRLEKNFFLDAVRLQFCPVAAIHSLPNRTRQRRLAGGEFFRVLGIQLTLVVFSQDRSLSFSLTSTYFYRDFLNDISEAFLHFSLFFFLPHTPQARDGFFLLGDELCGLGLHLSD